MSPPPHIIFNPYMIIVELVFLAIVMVLCLLIFFKTREIYELTRKKTIFFFRNTFLFFSVAFLIRFILILFILTDILPRERWYHFIVLMFMAYLSTMAIVSLLFSIIWKRIKFKFIYIIINIVVLFISVLIFFTRSFELLLFTQLILFATAIIMAILKFNKKGGLLTLYILLFLSWIINMYMTNNPRLMEPLFKVPLYLLSIILLGIIYYKVHKWIK